MIRYMKSKKYQSMIRQIEAHQSLKSLSVDTRSRFQKILLRNTSKIVRIKEIMIDLIISLVVARCNTQSILKLQNLSAQKSLPPSFTTMH